MPLALLSAAWTASLAGVGAQPSRAAQEPAATRCPTAPRCRPRPSRPPPASRPGVVAPGIERQRPRRRRHRLHLRHPLRRARGLPARRDRHQRRRPVLQPDLAAGRRDRPRRVRPRPRRRQRLDDEGVAAPGIYGIAAQRHATAPRRSRDTDAGQYDDDAKYDRAVGPMQFIPSTWSVVGVDADGDAQAQPAGRRRRRARHRRLPLLRQRRPLARTPGQRAAVYRYNHSQSYVDLVLSIMDAYLDGDFTSVPNGTTSAGYFVPDPEPPSGNGGRRRRQRPAAATTAGGGTGGTAAPTSGAGHRRRRRRRHGGGGGRHRRRPAGDAATPTAPVRRRRRSRRSPSHDPCRRRSTTCSTDGQALAACTSTACSTPADQRRRPSTVRGDLHEPDARRARRERTVAVRRPIANMRRLDARRQPGRRQRQAGGRPRRPSRSARCRRRRGGSR